MTDPEGQFLQATLQLLQEVARQLLSVLSQLHHLRADVEVVKEDRASLVPALNQRTAGGS